MENPPSNHSVSTSDDSAALSSVNTEQSTDLQLNQSHIEATSKPTSKKRRRSKFGTAGELMDKLIGIQEKSEK